MISVKTLSKLAALRHEGALLVSCTVGSEAPQSYRD